MPPLTSSEMRAWLTCQRGWWLQYHRGLRRMYELPSLPNIGNFYHDALEAYYNGELTQENLPKHVRERADKLIAEYPDLSDRILKDAELAAIMVEGYVQWIEETGADVGLEVVGAEVAVEAPVGPYILQGKIDARIERKSDGALLQLEHKTVGNLTDIPSYAQGALQFRNYALLAHLTKPDGVPTDGVIINMARRVKRTASAKPPFYARHEVQYNVVELRAHYKQVVAIGRQIEEARTKLEAGALHHDVIVPNVNRSHRWSCSCGEVSAMLDDGSDVEEFLAEFYEKQDPWARYAPNTEEVG